MTTGLDGLAARLAVAGARFDETSSPPYVRDFGDASGEERALREGAALSWSSDRRVVRVSGEDRAPFLHRLLSNDIAGLGVGQTRRALLLDTRGKIEANLDLWAGDEHILMLCDHSVAAGTVETLRRYVMRSAVQIELLPEQQLFLLGGPRAATLLTAVADVPEAGRSLATKIGPVAAVIARPRDGAGFEFLVEAQAAADLWQLLCEASEAIVVPVGCRAAEILRIERGHPAAGAELGGEEFPQEVGLDAAVDYEKGCYLGQETVARIHYRGRVNRELRGLRLDAPAVVGERVSLVEESVGVISSAAISAVYGPAALALLSRKVLEPGTELVTDSGATARVTLLPMSIG